MKVTGSFGVVLAAIVFVSGSAIQFEENDDRRMHPGVSRDPTKLTNRETQYEGKEHWYTSAQEALALKLKEKKIETQAKNVIFFLGDGMSVPTIAAARVFKGQKVDNLTWGEEGELHFESFPHIGVSKTFCSDSQVADSACSATAYLCGTKANEATMGLTDSVLRGDCEGQKNEANHVASILAWSQKVGKSTGIVTTARVTHASPGGAYANIADRDWENDFNIPIEVTGCDDIAKQLIYGTPGKDINVIMGGGRQKFLPNDVPDPETGSTVGHRRDGVNLPEEWKTLHPTNSQYITSDDELLAVNVAETDHLLGLFSSGHIAYLENQEADNDPSLEQMTRVAIEILSKNPNGYFLFVEGGRIDHAHHDGFAQKALWETIEFDKAIKKADEMTSEEDTLITVTADHAHVMTFAGYPVRGHNILSYPAKWGLDGITYPTLGYANGRGYRNHIYNDATGECERHDVAGDEMEHLDYLTTATAPLDSETHGGDDVLIYSRGPFSHLLTGVQQQSYIPHLLAYASCVGDHAKFCDSDTTTSTDSSTITSTDSLTSTTTGSSASPTTGSATSTTTESSTSTVHGSFCIIFSLLIIQIFRNL